MSAKRNHLFSNKDLALLLIPIIIEQLLNSFMGTIDSMMVSSVSPTALSAVSLVDSINVLIIQAFAALGAGGAIICSQYIGSKNQKKANEAATQLMWVITIISVVITALCLLFARPLLQITFGRVETAVMDNSMTYFLYTASSFPFIALFGAGSSIFRAQKNTGLPMTISVISNIINIAGNAFLIYVLHLGVAGAAISTLVSRVFCAVAVIILLRNRTHLLSVRNFIIVKPDWSLIKRILSIGIPSGIENSMFQFGKLAIQSTVSTLGTAAIAAQAMTNILENLNGIAAMGIGIGLMTIIGQCIGAGNKTEAKYYIKKLCIIGEVSLIFSCLLVFALVRPITNLARMTPESADMCFFMMCAITIFKPIFWCMAFIPSYGLRAAGDVRFSMISSICIMWFCRVAICIILIRFFNFGPIAVWIAMFTDWAVRSIIYTLRLRSGKWLNHQVI